MTMLTALIVDDEPLARKGLRLLLERDREVGAIHEAKDGEEALAAIRTFRPDLVFLDVQMPGMDGLAVVRQLEPPGLPALVFVTAHDEFALAAFELNALDYLLKPVTEDRFAKALARAKAHLQSLPQAEISRKILSLLDAIAVPRRPLRRFAVRIGGRTSFVETQEVQWIEAAQNYVLLHVGPRSHSLHVAMNTLEECLDAELFARIHRSYVVNIGFIKELQPAGHGEYVITLRDGVRLQSSRSYHERIKSLIANPF